MYCRYCGKELPNDSNFCPNCGKKQKVSKDVFLKFTIGRKILDFIKRHKIAIFVYFFWLLLNYTLYISSDRYNDSGQQFYPFDMPLSYVIQGGMPGAIGIKIPPQVEFVGRSLNYYDFTEFFTYAILIPIIILGVTRAIRYIISRKRSTKSGKEMSVVKNKEEIKDIEQSKEYFEQQYTITKSDTFICSTEQEFTKKEHINTFELFFKRFFATMVDKVLIVFIAGLCILLITSVYPYYAGELGTYSALFHMSSHDIFLMEQHRTEIDSCYSSYIWLDICFTLQFVVLNLIYYYFSERKWGASLCKHYFGLVLVSTKVNQEGKIINQRQTLLRAFIFLIIMIAMIALRWFSGINYYGVILFFFLILDFPILLTGKSMIDLLSYSKLISIDKQKKDKENYAK